MSDGTATLTFRDPDDFSVLGAVQVTDTGDPVVNLNELECVGDDVYANVWHTDDILRIDPDTGFVTARIDASDLLTPEEAADADVLNGIAALDGSDHFLVTGSCGRRCSRCDSSQRTETPGRIRIGYGRIDSCVPAARVDGNGSPMSR